MTDELTALFTSINEYAQQIDQLNQLLKQNPNYVTEQILKRNKNINERLTRKVKNLLAQSLDYQMKDLDIGIQPQIKIVDSQKDEPKTFKNQDLALNLSSVAASEKKPVKARKCDAINLNEIRFSPKESELESSLELVEWPTQDELKAVKENKHRELRNLQIGGIQIRIDRKCYSRFNFLLTNGIRRDVDTDVWDLETLKIPQDTIIQQVQYCVQLKDGFLLGVRFLDSQGNILVEGGKFHNVDRKHFVLRNIELESNERIVGFKGRVDPKKPVYLFDIQWKIAKTVGQTQLIAGQIITGQTDRETARLTSGR